MNCLGVRGLSVNILEASSWSRNLLSRRNIHKAAQNAPDIFSLTPPAPRKIMGSIIWLPGDEINQNGFADLWFLSLKPKYYRLVIPGPFFANTNNTNQRTWYNHKGSSVESEENEAELQESKEYVTMLIKEEMKKVPSSDSILIGGFGKGGALALFVGLQYGNQLGGIVSVNGYVPNSFAKVNTRSFKTETPILALHGKKNPVIPESFASKGYAGIKENLGIKDINVVVDDEGAHNFTDGQLGVLSGFFGNIPGM